MWGAALLVARAAARMGAGYTYVHSSSAGFPLHKQADLLFLKSARDIQLDQFNAICIGPGLTKSAFIKSWIIKLRKANFKNLVLDAEALNTLAKSKMKLSSSWIMTPHEGELARLLKVSSKSIQNDRKKHVLMAQKKFGCIVLLKGHHSLVADNKNLVFIPTGNAALAKAGTGDVLSGFISALLSQGVDAFHAACIGSYIHGKIADEWVKKKDPLALMASDLIEDLPKVLKKLRK